MQNMNVSGMGQNLAFINARGSIENLADEHIDRKMHKVCMDKTRRQKAMPLMVLPNGRGMKDQKCFDCLFLHHKNRNKAGDTYNDVSDAWCVAIHILNLMK
jgi:hypothetical protein